MSLRALRPDSWGSAIALVTIAVLTIGGALFLLSEFREIEAEVPQIEATKLREGFIALGDLHRLESAIDPSTERDAGQRQARARIGEALDILFLRAEAFKRLHVAEGEMAAGIIETLDRIVAAGDAAMVGGQRAYAILGREIRPLLEKARTQLVRYVDAQHQTQSAAIAEQRRILERMTMAAAVLLLILGVASATAVLLLNAEVVANRKRMAAEERARFLAFFDPLTGLLNRTSFTDRSKEILQREMSPAILLFDLDEFKAINDRYGHATGDAVLLAAAKRIERLVMEENGFAARLGGDEFVALLPHAPSAPETKALCGRLLSAFRVPVSVEDAIIWPRTSLGACRAPDLGQGEPVTLPALLRGADLALFEAKKSGRNTCVLYDSSLAAKAAERHEIERALPEALREQQLFFVYQPLVDLSTGEILGVEALVRWRRGEQVMSPESFIPVAEANGLIREIDLWMLREATRTVVGWIREGLPETKLSVNISSQHFRDSDIVEHVRDVLLESGLPPHLLMLEITETVLLEDWQKASELIGRLHALGISIALDDFGTGYSSLAYLQDLAVDVIKIDRAFVTRLETSSEAQFIFGAVVEIAKGLQKTVVVEGLETDAQVKLVQSFGCETGQGFYFARPMEPAEMQSTLRTAVMAA